MHYRSYCHYGIFLLTIAAAPKPPALALDLPALPAAPTIPALVVNLNAPADGVTDATAAINSAIASLSQQGGGTLQFGSGTYLVSVNPNANDYVLQIQSNVRLQGSSDGATVIQLAAAQAPYNTLIGNCCAIHDVDIDNITIDLNGLNNPVASMTERAAGVRSAIRVDVGARVRVAGCTILNVVDTNTLLFNGTVTDVEAANNTFPNVGQPLGSLDFDHSTIYANAVRVWIHGNTFTARYGPGTPDSRCAIETHGNDITVATNTIYSYSIGMNITGQAVSSNRQLYENNIITNTMNGIEIYSEVYRDNSTQGMQNVTIENNQITLNPIAWRTTGLVSISQPSMGIFLTTSPNQPAPINGMAIIGNQITFPTGGAPAWGDTYSGGLVLWTYNGQMTPISNLTFSGNTITNALGPAIWTNVTITGGMTVTSNTFINPARSSSSSEQTGIFFSGITANVKVESNTITDTANPPLIKIGLSVLSTCQSNCISSGNTVTPNTVTRSVLGPGWIH